MLGAPRIPPRFDLSDAELGAWIARAERRGIPDWRIYLALDVPPADPSEAVRETTLDSSQKAQREV